MRRQGRQPRSAAVNVNVVDRVAMTGTVMVVMVGFSLAAIVERALLTGGDSSTEASTSPPRAAGSSNDPAPARKSSTPRRAQPVLATLNGQVRSLTLSERGSAAKQAYGAKPSAAPLVGATRFTGDRTWAFGTAAIPVPAKQSAMPQVALFLARWSGSRWQVGLSGTEEFRALLRRVPTKLLPAAEIRALARFSVGPANPTKLMLPWKQGASWKMTAATRGARPLGAVTFQGGDGKVLAAGDGRLYRFCTSGGGGLLMIVHDNGLASVYYQLTKITNVRDGAVVKRGSLLGRIGVDRPCGGAAAARPQVRFGLRQGAGDLPFNGVSIGGWTFRERAQPLIGWAERGAQQVMPGVGLENFGPGDPPPVTKVTISPSPTPTPGST